MAVAIGKTCLGYPAARFFVVCCRSADCLPQVFSGRESADGDFFIDLGRNLSGADDPQVIELQVGERDAHLTGGAG